MVIRPLPNGPELLVRDLPAYPRLVPPGARTQ